MGLGAPKSRNKLSQDPNNTAWAKSSDSYGHKILSASGWKPGNYLGAENATHSSHYSAANASHIRVLLREDNLGLGAQLGKSNAETFGLSLFSGVLGRLNGKSDVEVEKQQGALRDAELRTYQAQKHGLMNFVSGGLLVGDKIEPPSSKSTISGVKRVIEDSAESKSAGTKKRKGVEGSAELKERTKSKKRRTEIAETEPVPTAVKSKRSSKSKAAKDNSEAQTDSASSAAVASANGDTRSVDPVSNSSTAKNVNDGMSLTGERTGEKRHKAKRQRDGREQPSTNAALDDEKSRAKLEKRARKEERRKRKDEKRRLRSQKQTSSADSVSGPSETSHKKSESVAPPSAIAFFGNRHASRQRYIQQKRMASMDPQAMKEIFMVKAVA